jgi:hypothetical protein
MAVSIHRIAPVAHLPPLAPRPQRRYNAAHSPHCRLGFGGRRAAMQCPQCQHENWEGRRFCDEEAS